MKRERLVDYLDRRLGLHAGRGSELLFYCPACIDRIGSDSSKRKFAVNVDKQRGQCFRCEFKFRDMMHLFRYINGGFVTPQERIMLRAEPPLVVTSVRNTVRDLMRKERGAESTSLKKHRLPREAKPLTTTNQAKMPWKRAVRYLEGRGFSIEDAMRCDVHYCASGKYKGYLVFPVYQGGEQVYWTSRYAGDGALVKSWNPDKEEGSYGREHCILGYDELVGASVAALVEGPLDRMAPSWPTGALMGKEMSDFQADLIDALVPHGLKELVIMLDPGAGKKIDAIYQRHVDTVPTVRVCYFDEGDPAERRDELPELMEERREPTLRDRIQSRLS